MFDGKMVEEGP